MEDLKKIYIDEIRLLQLFQESMFYGLDFDKVNYEVKNTHNFMQKKLNKNIDDKIEINCKEKIYKKCIEKYLEIKIQSESNKNDYQIYKIIIDNERIKLLCEKNESEKNINISKQFGLNGHIVYSYKDSKDSYILHQNVNNLLQYLETFNEDLYCSVFKFENDNIEYVSKLPYHLVYESIVNCNVFSAEQLHKYYAKENKKRNSINANELKLKKETKKNIENNCLKIKLVYDNSKDLYNYMIDEILKFHKFDEILQKGRKIVDELNSQENNYENESNFDESVNEISELQILKSQKLELIDIKKTTDEIINKLQNILIN